MLEEDDAKVTSDVDFLPPAPPRRLLAGAAHLHLMRSRTDQILLLLYVLGVFAFSFLFGLHSVLHGDANHMCESL